MGSELLRSGHGVRASFMLKKKLSPHSILDVSYWTFRMSVETDEMEIHLKWITIMARG